MCPPPPPPCERGESGPAPSACWSLPRPLSTLSRSSAVAHSCPILLPPPPAASPERALPHTHRGPWDRSRELTCDGGPSRWGPQWWPVSGWCLGDSLGTEGVGRPKDSVPAQTSCPHLLEHAHSVVSSAAPPCTRPPHDNNAGKHMCDSGGALAPWAAVAGAPHWGAGDSTSVFGILEVRSTCSEGPFSSLPAAGGPSVSLASPCLCLCLHVAPLWCQISLRLSLRRTPVVAFRAGWSLRLKVTPAKTVFSHTRSRWWVPGIGTWCLRGCGATGPRGFRGAGPSLPFFFCSHPTQLDCFFFIAAGTRYYIHCR